MMVDADSVKRALKELNVQDISDAVAEEGRGAERLPGESLITTF
jgi:hypothetical protein